MAKTAPVNYYELILPRKHFGTGESYQSAHTILRAEFQKRAGGHTRFEDVAGEWEDPETGKLLRETQIVYHIVCTEIVWEDIMLEVLALFSNEKCIFTAKIGEVTLYK